ncbi:TolC family protein [uncultured Desulfosarcina sp.]|uniref:TolC family protein n=1 Tax=uncultured Desulfosarcina sp. TaxID=218289 RepID=UPI0029C84EF4|nr:TolC family protein [uncultured Desulfosarcina sp.]
MPNPGEICATQPQASAFRHRWIACLVGLFFQLAAALPVCCQEPPPSVGLNLERTVALALEANVSAQISIQQTRAAEAVVKSKRTEFLPTFSTHYNYTRNDEPRYFVLPTLGLVEPEEVYTWVTRVTQPLFTGFGLTYQYKLARMGLDAARLNEALVRRDVVYETKRIYFQLLKALKLKAVAQEAVAMLEAQTEVAVNYHEVGMTPLNDLLKTKVELANARQDLVAAENRLEIARTNFNLLLRRPIDATVAVADMLEVPLLDLTIDHCLETAERDRLEVAVADLEIRMREKEVALARKDYFPSVQLQGSYYRQGTDWQVDGGEGVSDSNYWDVQAQASWDFWQWGRTGHGVAEKKSRLAEARLNRTQLMDDIQLEVKQAWQKAEESEKNIATVQSAIDQARESFRISEELFKEQMATSTDVLDARTQLSETTTRYYNALYDFRIALAALDRAMGKPSIDIAEAR